MGYAVLKHKVGNGYKEYELSKPVTTLGRSQSNDIVIDDSSLSRLHIRLENRDGRYFILDNNSSNGTYLNRRKISESLLNDGDRIITGRMSFLFSYQEDMVEGGRTQAFDAPEHMGVPGSTMSMDLDHSDKTSPLSTVRSDLEPIPPLPKPPPPPPPPNYHYEEDEPETVESLNPDDMDGLPTAPQAPVSRTGRTTPAPQPAMGGENAQPLHRFVAYLLDYGVSLVLMIPSIILMILQMPGMGALFSVLGGLAATAHLVFGWFKYGKTLGKHLMGIRVIEIDNPNGAGLTPRATILRFLGYMICSLPFFLLFLPVAFNEDGQGLHDKISGTRVIKE